MRHAIIAAAALVVAVPVLAQMPTTVPGKPNPRLVTAGTYNVDPGHTHVSFTVNHMGFSEYTGQFGNPSGTIAIDPARPNATRLDISFPIESVSTTSDALDRHLKGKDFFDAEHFPTGRFVSTAVVTRGNTATVTGNLTLRGVTRPVTLQARFIGAGPSPMGGKLNFGFAATGTIKRSDFGISYGVPIVSDEVRLAINAAFVAA